MNFQFRSVLIVLAAFAVWLRFAPADAAPAVAAPFAQQAVLSVNDGPVVTEFGRAIAVSGNTVAVGRAATETTPASVYVFVRAGATWTQQQILLGGDGAANLDFGASVAVSGDTIVVGDPSIVPLGAAYVFVRAGAAWIQQQKLTPNPASTSDIGGSVAVAGDTLVLGAFNGQALVFTRSGTMWTQQQELTHPTAGLGNIVALASNTVVTGAPDESGAQGAADVYVRSGAMWTHQQRLLPADPQADAKFGFALSIDSDNVLIGAPAADGIKGAAYVFTRSGTAWTQQQKLVATDGSAGDQFGTAAAITGDTAIVGAPGASLFGQAQGAVYVFMRMGTAWAQQQKLFAAGGLFNDEFGTAAAQSGDTFIVSKPTRIGAAYVFTANPACNYAVAPATQNFALSGGTGAVNVTAPGGCSWQAAHNVNAPWLFLNTANGAGNGAVNFTVEPHPGGPARSGTLTVAGQIVTVTQDAAPCNYAIAPHPLLVPLVGGQFFINVDTAPGCAWGFQNPPAWVNNLSANGLGPGALSFTVDAAAAPRIGTLTVAGKTATIIQGHNCNFSLTNIAPNPANFTVAGGTGGFNITGNANCPWSAESTAPWLTITSGASGMGNGAVNYAVAANSAGPRTARIRAAGLELIVTQAGTCPTIAAFPAGPPTPMPGTHYYFRFIGTGGAWPYVYSLLSGQLPDGLSFGQGSNGLDGSISGTPTNANAAAVVIRITDAAGCMNDATFNFTSGCPPFTINPTNRNHAATAGSDTVSVTGMTGCSWTAISNAPWLSVTAGASGNSNGNVSYAVAANNGLARSGTLTIAGQTFTVTQANGCPTITLNPAALPNAQLGALYTQAVSVTPPGTYNLALTAGVLPSGLTFANGVLSGTPTVNGDFSFTLTATNANTCTGARPYVLTVCPIVTIAPDTLLEGRVGSFYAGQNFTATPPPLTGPINWSASGNFPPGLSINAATGALSGTPTQSGQFAFSVSAAGTVAPMCVTSRPYTLTIRPACSTITIEPPALARGFVGTAYNQPLTASPPGSYGFGVTEGKLPGGLSLNPSTGALTGTPTAAGAFTFTVTAGDTNLCFGMRQYTLMISGNGLMFYALPRPLRLLDTRANQGPCDNISTPIAAGGTLNTQARLTCDGITIPASAQAIVGNVTALNQTASFGFLTLFPAGQPLPLAANMIYQPGQLLSNNFTVGLSTGGEFSVFAERTLHAVIDVSGYFAPPGTGGLFYHALPRPLRLLDTRAGGPCDTISTPIAAGGTLNTQARLTCDGVTIPAAAQAIVGNVTALNQTAAFGFLTLFPAGQPLPLAANMIYAPNQLLSNAFVVGLSASGEFSLFGERALHAVVDVAGYYSAETSDANGAGLLFTPLARPVRLLDTRPGGNCDNITTPIAAMTSLTTQARVTCEAITIPPPAQAIIGNVTAINQTAQFGFLTIYPNGVALPLAANLIYAPGELLSNAFFVGLSASGEFNVFGERTIHVVVDVAGYFAP